MGGSVKRAIRAPATADAAAGRNRPSTRSSGAPNPRGASKTAQTVLKHLTNGDASALASRISNSNTRAGRSRGAGLTYLRVKGLKESKATSNQDGGLKDLINFLERKASSFTTGRQKRQVMIKKVCNIIDKLPGCTDFRQQVPVDFLPVWGHSF